VIAGGKKGAGMLADDDGRQFDGDLRKVGSSKEFVAFFVRGGSPQRRQGGCDGMGRNQE